MLRQGGGDGAQTRSCKLIGPPNPDEERIFFPSSERANAQSESLNMKRRKKKKKKKHIFFQTI
jgi:hypothetical protein